VKRRNLHDQLREISMQIVALGTLVETALSQALQAVRSGEQALCGLVIESDETINTLRSELEEQAFRSLTLQQPLGGRDLRFLSSVIPIAADLERMGDNAKGVAQLLLRMIPVRAAGMSEIQIDPSVAVDRKQKGASGQALTEETIISELLDLGQEALRVLQGTMQAFKKSDADAARAIWQEDDVVDVRYALVRHDLMTMLSGIHAISALQQDALIMQRLTYWLWIAHNLERVADHCTNICERTVFFIEGDTIIKASEAE